MAVYWVGADNNIWYKGDDGAVINRGAADAFFPGGSLSDAGASGHRSGSFAATRIADPNAPRTPAPTGGGGAARPTLNQAAVNNTQLALDQLPGLLQAALDAENQRYRNTIGGFDSQEQQQRQTYDTSTVTNQQNYDSNFMDSIRAGIKGLGGLFNILRGTGAAGSTVEGDVRDVVGGITAQDIRAGADTQKENQGQLDTSLSSFLTELGMKRRQNEDTRVNNEQAIRRDNATQMQDLLGKMAGFYGDADRVAERDMYMARAGALTPEIAQNSRTQVSAYDTTPVAVKAPELTAFSAPSQPDVVAAPSDGQVGAGIFTMTPRRDREREQTQVRV